MTPIVSRTTTERLVRASILLAVLLPYTAWCYYDWYIGYPRKYLAKAVENLPERPSTPPSINRRVTRANAAGIRKDAPLAEVRQIVGEPSWRNGAELRYFGPGGVLRLTTHNDKVVTAEWIEPEAGKVAEHDLLGQLVMAVGLTVIAAPVLGYYLLRVLGFRCVLSDAGLKHPGHPLIPFEAMQSLTYYKPERYDLNYTLNGRTRPLHLDEYKIKALPGIMDEICRRKNFAKPAPPSGPND